LRTHVHWRPEMCPDALQPPMLVPCSTGQVAVNVPPASTPPPSMSSTGAPVHMARRGPNASGSTAHPSASIAAKRSCRAGASVQSGLELNPLRQRASAPWMPCQYTTAQARRCWGSLTVLPMARLRRRVVARPWRVPLVLRPMWPRLACGSRLAASQLRPHPSIALPWAVHKVARRKPRPPMALLHPQPSTALLQSHPPIMPVCRLIRRKPQRAAALRLCHAITTSLPLCPC